ncbi:MAG: SpoIID/LytB domain-containing protein [Actinobacteria bacterium]|nr:SpoIID/LytB domain-containing protein [Actinomycetota bacterium]
MLDGWKVLFGTCLAVFLFGSVPAIASERPPAGPVTWEASSVTIEPLGSPLRVGDSAYRGRIHLQPRSGAVDVINEVAVEDYVSGIREMPPSWPIEAQRAQAVAARSYALHQALAARSAGRPSDLCATAACQVYGGIDAERRGGPAWEHAVRSTTSEVLAYRGAPILAMYSSSNGGRTVAGSKPYLRSTPDPDDAASPHHRWRVEVPETAVGAAVALPEGAELLDVEREGSVVMATWEGPQPSTEETASPVPVAEFRSRLEAAHPAPAGLPRLLPSTAFGLGPGSDEHHVVIEGGGWGHGVGMSQHGALGKARRGMKSAEILAAYYAGLRPAKAAPSQVPDTLRVQLAHARKALVSGEGAFRILADGVPVATGGGHAAWAVSMRGGRLTVSAPPGWSPPEPEPPVVVTDPFELAATAPASGDAPALALRSSMPSAGVEGAWRGLAVILLLGVFGLAWQLGPRPDLGLFRRE